MLLIIFIIIFPESFFFNSGKYFITTWPTKSTKTCSHGFTKTEKASTRPAGSGLCPLNICYGC